MEGGGGCAAPFSKCVESSSAGCCSQTAGWMKQGTVPLAAVCAAGCASTVPPPLKPSYFEWCVGPPVSGARQAGMRVLHKRAAPCSAFMRSSAKWELLIRDTALRIMHRSEGSSSAVRRPALRTRCAVAPRNQRRFEASWFQGVGMTQVGRAPGVCSSKEYGVLACVPNEGRSGSYCKKHTGWIALHTYVGPAMHATQDATCALRSNSTPHFHGAPCHVAQG